MYDLLVTGGLVALGGEPVPADLAVADGRIAAVLDPGRSRTEARSTLDADGLLVLPGLVDAHVHCREPGLEHKEDFASASRAAAAGGVTTIMVMPTDDPFTDTADRLREKSALARRSSIVDVALQAVIGPERSDIAALVAAGAASFEAFLSDVPDRYRLRDDGDLLAVMEAVAAAGTILGVTPGSPSVTGLLEARLRCAGRRDPEAFALSRPPMAEAAAVSRICLAARATGARTHVRQVSAAESVAILSALKPGSRISAEVTAHNLLLDQGTMDAFGPFAKVVPPLRSGTDVAAVRDALRSGAIDIVVTDHAPHAQEEKSAGHRDIWAAPGGFPGLQTLLPALLALQERTGIELPRLLGAASERPARLFGLYPRKGFLGPGADADLVLVDASAACVVTAGEQFSKARRTPFEGMAYRGRVIRTLVRGRTVYADGACIDEATGIVLRPAPRAVSWAAATGRRSSKRPWKRT